MTVQPRVDVLAHHALLLAIPAFFPAVAVVGVVIWVAVRDRRTHDGADTVERNDDPE
jgi:hypothetical protein